MRMVSAPASSKTLSPKRTAAGPMPHLIQTVGRADRYAIKMELIVRPGRECVASDLLSLAREGCSWKFSAAVASAPERGEILSPLPAPDPPLAPRALSVGSSTP